MLKTFKYLNFDIRICFEFSIWDLGFWSWELSRPHKSGSPGPPLSKERDLIGEQQLVLSPLLGLNQAVVAIIAAV